MTDVFSDLIGQDHVVAQLRAAAAEGPAARAGQPTSAMTHAWLLTGPPGSGRSTAALALAERKSTRLNPSHDQSS